MEVQIQRMKTAWVIVFCALLAPTGPSLANGSAPSLLAATTSVSRDPAPVQPADESTPVEAEFEATNGGHSKVEGNRSAQTPLVLWSPRTDRGAPALREGGATRGATRKLTLLTLVPKIDEAALTIAEQPVLHWYLSIDISDLVSFTLIDPAAVDPVVELMLEGPHSAGLHTVDLADHGVKLETDRRYEWYVAVVPNPDKRSSDTVARASIERVAEPELAARVRRANDPAEAVQILAAAGIWYDALERAQRDAAQVPKSEKANARLTRLLEQVDLELPTR